MLKPSPQKCSRCTQRTKCTEEKMTISSKSVKPSLPWCLHLHVFVCVTHVSAGGAEKQQEAAVTLPEDTRWPEWKLAISTLKTSHTLMKTHKHRSTDTHIQMHVRKPLPPTPASDVPVLTVGAADDSPAEKWSASPSLSHLSALIAICQGNCGHRWGQRARLTCHPSVYLQAVYIKSSFHVFGFTLKHRPCPPRTQKAESANAKTPLPIHTIAVIMIDC